MAKTNAWHLRNDGQAFPVKVHLYPMQDNDLSSEAEVAAFIIKTNSWDKDLAEYVLDAFMVLLLDHETTKQLETDVLIEEALTRHLSRLPFKFAYPLSIDELLEIHRSQHNFYDLDSITQFMDEVLDNRENIQKKIKESFDQQFIRVRYGGKYDTTSGNSCIWFRIASVDYNWDNVIYIFAADMRRQYNIEYITICRDNESDGTDPEDDNFYKAKDGTAYYMMPIDEFFEESHEKNPVFSSSEIGAGIIHTIRSELRKGNTILGAYDLLEREGVLCTRDYRPYLLRKEIEQNCISASEWFDTLKVRTKQKISKFISNVKSKFPEILGMDVDYAERENNRGGNTGFELLCKLISTHPKIDNVTINIAYTKPLSTVTSEMLLRVFSHEYGDFIKYAKIKI